MIYFIFGIVHNRLNLLLMSLMSVTFTLKLQYVFETVPNFRLSYIIFLGFDETTLNSKLKVSSAFIHYPT